MLLLLAATGTPVWAQDSPYSSTDFGGIGLLQTRTARFANDGQFDVGVSQILPYRRYLLNIQALPWVEGTFRYTEVKNRAYFSTGVIGENESTYKDRGADLKFKLLNEGRFVPALAAGVQDGLGTGQFAGEYLVASKRYYDLDFSVGLGWGNVGSRGGIRNPLISLSDAFRSRTDAGGSAFGGTLSFGSWFRGEEIALFGGVEYFTPIKGLSIKAEIDGNNYQREPLSNVFVQDSAYNIGFNYRPFSWVEFSVGRERGNLFMFRGTLRANFNTAGAPKLDAGPPPLVPRPVSTVVTPRGTAVAVPRIATPWRNHLDDRRIASEQLAVQAALVHQGISSTYSGRYGDALWFHLTNVSSLPPRSELERIAKVVAPSRTQAVVLRVTTPDGAAQTMNIPLGVVNEGVVASFFFDEMDRLGLTPIAVEFFTGLARVQVEEPLTDDLALKVAQLSVLTSPEVVNEVVVESLEGSSRFRVPLSRIRSSLTAPTVAQNVALVQSETDAGSTFELGDVAAGIFQDLRVNGLLGESVNNGPTRMTLLMSNLKYTSEAMAFGRAARIMANHAPPNIEELEIVTIAGGIELARVVLLRRDIENAVSGVGSIEEILARATIDDAPPRTVLARTIKNPRRYPAFSTSLSPVFKQHLGGGDVFLAYALGVRAGAEVEMAKGFSLSGSVIHNLTDTFDLLTVTSNSKLPKVRSDIREYLQGSDTSLTKLQMNYLAKLAPDMFGRVSAGYFEEMYGGFSGEVLYRPFGGRFATGIDLNVVRQRDFLGKFGFLDYSVTTWHLNLYYDAPFQNLLLQAHAGRYLAGDLGATFQVSRVFEAGVRAGVFATFTDVPFDVFGEGSFDKGFFVSMPLELFFVTRTRQGGTFAFKPLTKDGGQQVFVAPRLYDVTAQGNLNNIVDDWGDFLQ